jgi:hypothetical protein
MTTATKLWMTTGEIVEASGRHEDTVLLALRRGLLKGVQSGYKGRWRAKSSDVEAWVEAGAPWQVAS